LIPEQDSNRPRVCAVSYLNTVPLVWGLLRDPALQRVFDLGFALPSVCADQLASGETQIGIVPAIEVPRQNLEYFRSTGISSDGPVRSILLISKVPFHEIRRLATDWGSRTSVMLSRIILAEKFGVDPKIISHPPDLAAMLGLADAALLIGDAALHFDPASSPFETLDLGFEWTAMTGLPMVFAVWAGRKEHVREPFGQALMDSCKFGLAHLEDIVREESPKRALPESLVREYLSRHIVFEFTDRHYAGLQEYWKRAAALDHTGAPKTVSV
jgi:chorismate dehydratase